MKLYQFEREQLESEANNYFVWTMESLANTGEISEELKNNLLRKYAVVLADIPLWRRLLRYKFPGESLAQDGLRFMLVKTHE